MPIRTDSLGYLRETDSALSAVRIGVLLLGLIGDSSLSRFSGKFVHLRQSREYQGIMAISFAFGVLPLRRFSARVNNAAADVHNFSQIGNLTSGRAYFEQHIVVGSH